MYGYHAYVTIIRRFDEVFRYRNFGIVRRRIDQVRVGKFVVRD